MLHSVSVSEKFARTPFSVLDLASVKADESPREALLRSAQLAQRAEQWGYKRFWVAEHHNAPGIASSAPAVLISHIAAKTSTIRVGSGGVMLPNHSPLVIAEEFGSLECLYPGRIDLGIGRAPGTDPQTARALRRHLNQTGADMPELLWELQRYFNPEPGQYVHAVPGVGMDVPIWILGSSVFSGQMAADVGLPYAFASHFAPDELYSAIELYRARFISSKQLKAPYVMVSVPVLIADTDEEAERLFTTTYQRFVALTRGKSTALKPPLPSMEGYWNEAEEQYVKSRFVLACVGSPRTVVEKLENILKSTRADELMIVSDAYDFNVRLRTFETLSQLKSRRP